VEKTSLLWNRIPAGIKPRCLGAEAAAAERKGAACPMPKRHQVSNPENPVSALQHWMWQNRVLPCSQPSSPQKKTYKGKKEEDQCSFLPITLRIVKI